MSNTRTAFLPVPDIQDQFCHSYKSTHKDDSTRVRPPKLRPRYHDFSASRSNSSICAQAVSFKDITCRDNNILSPMYNSSRNESYFDQCFTKICKIGEGCFGKVYKVHSKDDGLLYAVKMSKQYFRSEHYRQERLEEVRRYEQFSDHENCVRLYRAWEQDDRLYMQMELCNESLEHYLARKKRIPEEKIWSILLDLLLALKSLHDRNLIHLDIKLDNVLVGDDGICKLADFGLVVDVDRANRHQATEGDCRYIAPELMMGRFSKAADVFSLGIAILELSSFIELPPNGPLWQELRSGILPEEFIKPISNELKKLIKSMMSPDPLARPTVNELLGNRKLFNLLQKRRRWDLVKKIKQSYRKSRRVFWSQLCNFRNFLYAIILSFLTSLKFKDTEPTNSRDSINDSSFTNENSESFCNQSTPTHFGDNSTEFINSTPLNHHQNFRSRKDLTKCSFRLDLSQDLSFSEYEAVEEPFVRQKLDMSSLTRKQLFSTVDDMLESD